MKFNGITLRVGAIVFFVQLCFALPGKRDQLSVEVKDPKVEDIPYEPEIKTVIDKQLPNEENGKVSYAKTQLWNVGVETDEKKKALLFLKSKEALETWGGNSTNVDVLIMPNDLNNVSKFLKQNNMNYIINIEDLQDAIDKENPPLSEENLELQNRKGHRLTWSAYHRLSDIYSYLDFLSISYPSLVSVKTIGTSVEGRPIKVLKISNGQPRNKAIWLDGGMHAREWISPSTVTYIANYLIENFHVESKSVNGIDWHILAVANPDGYEYSHTRDRLWRKNRSRNGHCSGVDLNRNFGYHWGEKGSGPQPCQEIYRGNAPFSEPESSAIRDYFTQEDAHWRGYISMHSYGQYILYPWGYDTDLPPDHQALHSLGNKMAKAIQLTSGAQYRVGTAAKMLYPAAGGSDDWAKGSIGIKYAYTIELRDSGRYGFILPSSYINPTAKEALAAVKVIAEAVDAL